jgi:hypothetical protein
MKITVATLVDAPLRDVWSAYTTPEDIKAWNAATPDWHTTSASVDLRPGGKFSSRMEARDGSFGFDFYVRRRTDALGRTAAYRLASDPRQLCPPREGKEFTMTTAIIFHEVENGAVWARAWKTGPGSRHEMFAKIGVKCRNFRDPNNPDATGVMAEIPDMAKFQALLQSDEGRKAMQEDGLKVETMRMLVEFTP